MSTKYVAAFLLLHTAGKKDIDAKAIQTVLSSVGIVADEKALEDFLANVKGKDIDELVKEGMSKLNLAPSPKGNADEPLSVPTTPTISVSEPHTPESESDAVGGRE